MTRPATEERSLVAIGRSVAALYEASYPRLVALLTLVTGDRQEAEEVVQEAFIRLIPRWDRVSRYDDPEAWVRRVAVRLSTSRWRRAQAAMRARRRLGPPPDAEPPSTARVEAERLLAGLSVVHREVLVLHHGLGLTVQEIARQLGIAEGTVKSRLHRARASAASIGADDE